ncbi:helix-turn-helix domain-containing protein [Azospirillum sp. B21]|nr:helix-turn-helix domain-containing protein [Azospirillum sp. B21]
MHIETLPADQLTYSVRMFCAAVGISPRTFYVMQQRGDGPPVVRVGRRTLIRKAAAEAWLAGQECR